MYGIEFRLDNRIYGSGMFRVKGIGFRFRPLVYGIYSEPKRGSHITTLDPSMYRTAAWTLGFAIDELS